MCAENDEADNYGAGSKTCIIAEADRYIVIQTRTQPPRGGVQCAIYQSAFQFGRFTIAFKSHDLA